MFGWFQNFFIGREQDSAYSLMAGYLKGAEQTGTDVGLILDLMLIIPPEPGNAGMYTYLCSIA